MLASLGFSTSFQCMVPGDGVLIRWRLSCAVGAKVESARSSGRSQSSGWDHLYRQSRVRALGGEGGADAAPGELRELLRQAELFHQHYTGLAQCESEYCTGSHGLYT